MPEREEDLRLFRVIYGWEQDVVEMFRVAPTAWSERRWQTDGLYAGSEAGARETERLVRRAR